MSIEVPGVMHPREDDTPTVPEVSKADGTAVTISSPLKRDSDEIEDDSDSYATTPVAGRAKRHRWVWTLGPIQPVSQDISSSVDGDGKEGLHDS